MDAPVVSYPLMEFADRVRARLAQGHLMAVILDPLQWGNVEKDVIQASSQWTLLYRGDNTSGYYTVMPYVVYLRETDAFFPEFVRRIGRECCIVAEIADAAAFDSSQFISFLRDAPCCVTPDGQNGFLRYYDPSILAALVSCAGKDQWARLFGPYISAFWYEDAHQETVFCRPRPDTLPAPAPEPWKLSPGTMEKLLEAQYEKYVQTVETEIRKEFYPDSGQPGRAELRPKIRTALDMAERYSYISRSEGYQFVRAAARHGWDFYEREPFQKLLQDPGLSRLHKLEALRAAAGENV